MINTTLIAALIIQLCPNPDKMGYFIDYPSDEKIEVNCDEYYTNDIINHPDKYKELLKNVKAE